MSINVVITADRRPLPFASTYETANDGYSNTVEWLSSGADSYEVFTAAAAAGFARSASSASVVLSMICSLNFPLRNMVWIITLP